MRRGEAYHSFGTPDAVVLDAANGGYPFGEQVSKHRAVCSWCTVAAGASLVTVPLVLPEAARAWRALRRAAPGRMTLYGRAQPR